MSEQKNSIQVTPASPWKRLFAWVYDWLPAVGIFILTLVAGLAIVNLILGWLFDDSAQVSESIRNHPLWILFLISGVSYYYLWCWVKGGQTVGLRTWNIKIVNEEGGLLTWQQSILRALLSMGGLANFWSFLDKDYRGWHDIAVGAYLVQLPKQAKTKEEKKPLI